MGKPSKPANASKSANATEAPTSGSTAAKLAEKTSGAGFTEEQMDFINLMEQFYGVHGHVMTLSEALSVYSFEHNEYVELIRHEGVRAALHERGVTIRDSAWQHLRLIESGGVGDGISELVSPNSSDSSGSSNVVLQEQEPVSQESSQEVTNWRDKALTPLQLIVANTMLDLIDTRSQKKKLQDLGVSTSQYNNWLKNPTFAEYLKERAEAMLGENQHEAHLALLDKIRMGDLKAIEYYNEMTGRFVKERSTGQGTTQLTDFKMMLIRILEILNDEIDDPDVALRISERIRGLIGAQTVAGQLMGEQDTIVTPQIAKAREISPKVQELMERGLGA